ncbi:MAG: thioredoxin [Clostridia bacterium]|nr:thioredoxin [Clostridia bacterium]
MKILNNETFNSINNDDFCVVDFSATWCGPCRMLKPIMEEIETLLPDVKFYNVDVDDAEDVAKDFRIFSIPTIMVFKNGQAVDSMVGLGTQDEIIEFINKNR